MILLCLLVAMKLTTMGPILLCWYSHVGHLAHPAAAGGEEGFLMALSCLLVIMTLPCCCETRLVTTPRLLDGFHPNCSFDSLDSGDSVVIPQDGGHGDRSGQVLDFVGIDGGDDLLLI
jgi:hypothetical protein